jgi:hypothetical protein
MVKKTGSRSAATKPTPHQALTTDQHQIALCTTGQHHTRASRR